MFFAFSGSYATDDKDESWTQNEHNTLKEVFNRIKLDQDAQNRIKLDQDALNRIKLEQEIQNQIKLDQSIMFERKNANFAQNADQLSFERHYDEESQEEQVQYLD